jgi:signal transduction histidine kinase
VLQASRNVAGEAAIADLTDVSEEVTFETISISSVGEGDFVVASALASGFGGTVVVTVGQSTEAVEEATRPLIGSLLIGAPLLLLLVAGVTWLVVGRALGPVEAIRVEVDTITARNHDRRVAVPASGDEIARLAKTMNAMLDRLSAASSRQRRFVADASHELRSPLSSIRTQLEVELAHPEGADWPQTGRELLRDTMRLQRLVDDLLSLSQADNPDPMHQVSVVDIDDVVLREVRRLRQRGAVDVDATEVTAVQAIVDPDGIGRVVRNLLDNAERHARSRVMVSLIEIGAPGPVEWIEIAVIDDGPGIPPDERSRVFERFTRLDEARDRDTGGTGLGLPIARQIAEAHGGSLFVAEVDPGHGTRLVLRLPPFSSGPTDQTPS